MKNALSQLAFTSILCLGLFAISIQAQTTEFTYQGRLTDSSMSANGNYDFEFRLCASSADCISPIAVQQRLGIFVSNGIFTVRLDFGTNGFPGANRFLEIAIRPAGSTGGFQQLLPRQPINSTPYAIRSLSAASADNSTNATNATSATTASNANNLGGQPASAYVQTGTNAFIRNQTAQQGGANFNIDGIGKANIFDVTTQYNISGNRVLSIAGTANLFAGVGTGAANTTGTYNLFIGTGSGQINQTGSFNSFLGATAGRNNTTGGNNSFIGKAAGYSNSTGGSNSFFGAGAGESNVGGSENSFFGKDAGLNNIEGNNNSFFGVNAGSASTGNNNTFIGALADNTNSNNQGSTNTAIGYNAKIDLYPFGFPSPITSHNATAIGANAIVMSPNALVLGSIAGLNGAGTSTNVGIGTAVPGARLHVAGNAQISSTLNVGGILTVGSLGSAGSTQLCHNASNQISTCSSSLRYKTNITPFNYGLNLVNRLQPITFKWKEGGMLDLGLGAEDVEKIEPLLVTYNKNGQIEGVKYDRIGIVLLNAVKEQQVQIEEQKSQLLKQQERDKAQQEQIQHQQRQIEQQQIVIDGLKKLLCQQNPQAEVCKKENK
ncbi:MAG: tail fiber domain-containing protein [Acidobacteriota bacterium]|nr:tail fiber domain-containing protein [Acidobacteriota bacterium]